MFCFQSPFTRATRVLSSPLSSGKSNSSTIGAILPSGKSCAVHKPTDGPRRRLSEATSEGSGCSSIAFIDQDRSISERSNSTSTSTSTSTDTLPDVKADYLDPVTLSPSSGVESRSRSGSDSVQAECKPDESSDREKLLLNDDRNRSPRCSASRLSPKKKRSSPNGNNRCRKFLLRLRSGESSNSRNKDTRLSSLSTSTSPSLSPSLLNDSIETESADCSRERRKDYETIGVDGVATTKTSTTKTATTTTLFTKSSPSVLIDCVDSTEPPEQTTSRDRRPTASENDVSSLRNAFPASIESGTETETETETENENDYQRETETETEEERSSLPLSPSGPLTHTTGLSSSLVVAPYYDFLCVNGGPMRQEMTSTSSPQLCTVANLESSKLDHPTTTTTGKPRGSFDAGDKFSRLDSLMPEGPDGGSFCLPAARSCPNLEGRSAGCSPTSGGSSTSSTGSGPVGPRFKPIEEGDIQLCLLNHSNTLVRKILSSKFLRRWETHRLYLNDACISSKTPTGFLQYPIPYGSMSDIRRYAVVARWDPTYKNCLSIVLPDSCLLLQANNAYTRDQWYHSILWKWSIFKYQQLASLNAREEVMAKQLKSMVEFALWTTLQDERVAVAPLEAAAKLLEDTIAEERSDQRADTMPASEETERKHRAEMVLYVVSPLLERAALPANLARVLIRLVQLHPRSTLVSLIGPAITRCLKHTVDFGKSPDMRKLLQAFVAALHEAESGEKAIRGYVASVHGPGSGCPHPRVLPNLVSVCVAAIFHRFDAARRSQQENDETPPPPLPPLDCYLFVLNVASEYADWRPGLGALLQPVPFPEEALATKEVQQSVLLCVIKRLAKDSRCVVHRFLLPIREPRPGWIHVAVPSSPACPDQGELFGEMLTTLLDCCCRRKRFVGSLMKQARDDCVLLAARGCEAAQKALCLMLEWHLLPNEEARLQIVNALESTGSGKDRYAALCQRQRNLQELQQKGGPRKLTLPVRATDADVAILLGGGGALGNLECLSLAFTSVTSACAEQLIKLPALRYLNLWATQFGDAGLQMISEHLQKLQVLNLCETPVSDKGISTLASLTSLRKLNLNSTKLSVQTFESLKKCLPALQEFDVRYTEAW